MPAIQPVRDNPNAKAGTFDLGTDLMGPFAKVAISRSSALRPFSPLVDYLFKQAGGFSRMDMATRDGKTLLTISSKVLTWDDRMLARVVELISGFFDSRQQAFLPNDLTGAIAARKIAAQKAFDPGSDQRKRFVVNSFTHAVNPALAKDGGAMELLDVTIAADGKVTAEVAMVGSCNGCSSATLSTLKNAESYINEVFDEARAAHPNEKSFQNLKMQPIVVREVPEFVMVR